MERAWSEELRPGIMRHRRTKSENQWAEEGSLGPVEDVLETWLYLFNKTRRPEF